MRVFDNEIAVLGQLADDSVRAALSSTDRRKRLNRLRRNGEHITLLRLVAPELHRGHAGLVVRHGAQRDARAAMTLIDDLGNGVRQTARADVVDR